MDILKRCISFIDRFNDRIGRVFSVIVVPIIFILIYEVFMRYIFKRPTIWAHELSGNLYAVFFLIGGLYCLRWDNHVKADIFYINLSKKNKAIVDLCTYILFYMFIFTIFWLGLQNAYTAVGNWEYSSTSWGPPVWPIKLFIPFIAFLMLLQGLSKTIKDIYFIFSGKDFLIDVEKGDEKN